MGDMKPYVQALCCLPEMSCLNGNLKPKIISGRSPTLSSWLMRLMHCLALTTRRRTRGLRCQTAARNLTTRRREEMASHRVCFFAALTRILSHARQDVRRFAPEARPRPKQDQRRHDFRPDLRSRIVLARVTSSFWAPKLRPPLGLLGPVGVPSLMSGKPLRLPDSILQGPP